MAGVRALLQYLQRRLTLLRIGELRILLGTKDFDRAFRFLGDLVKRMDRGRGHTVGVCRADLLVILTHPNAA